MFSSFQPTAIDIATNNLLTSIENNSLTLLFKIISIISEPNLLILILLAAALYLFFMNSKSKGIFLISSTIATGLSILILKNLFQRPRPLNSVIETTGFSFPSGHATTIVFFLGALIYLFSDKKTRMKATYASIPIIFLVAFSRLYLRVHYLTDIIAGIILGSLILWASITLHKKYG